MAYDPVKPFTVSIASGVTFSSAIDVGTAYRYMSLEIPSMASTTNVQILVSDTLAGTYRTLWHAPTTTSGSVSMIIAASNAVVPLPALHHRYMKVALGTASADSAYTFKVYGG